MLHLCTCKCSATSTASHWAEAMSVLGGAIGLSTYMDHTFASGQALSPGPKWCFQESGFGFAQGTLPELEQLLQDGRQSSYTSLLLLGAASHLLPGIFGSGAASRHSSSC